MGSKSKSIKRAKRPQGQNPQQSLQMSLLNMRQLYESAVQDKIALEQANSELKLVLATALVKAGGQLIVSQEDVEMAQGAEGLNFDPDGEGSIVLSVYFPEGVVEEVEEDGEES